MRKYVVYNSTGDILSTDNYEVARLAMLKYSCNWVNHRKLYLAAIKNDHSLSYLVKESRAVTHTGSLPEHAYYIRNNERAANILKDIPDNISLGYN